MQIQTNFQDGILYMRLNGEMDEHSASLARRNADRMADEYAARCEKVMIDLQNVSFMDSTGIGFLIGRYKKFSRFGIPVFVVNPTAESDRILSISGVYTLIQRL